ncbi:hypothetical protein GVN24_24620 [Rhizobium sp. CRIBSB]|nr:hypothetical protein [Rhizobium sp. CRIBSB]
MSETVLTPADEAELLNLALADLGSIVRRSRFGTLNEADFDSLMLRARTRIRRVRDQLLADDLPSGALELTDIGEALAIAGEITRDPAFQRLLQTPGLMRGCDVPSPAEDRRAQRMPCVNGLGVIDGGRS